jgi:hypothetical protein
MADVKTHKILLVKSVDVRGNTDDTCARSLTYLVKNGVLTAEVKAGGN